MRFSTLRKFCRGIYNRCYREFSRIAFRRPHRNRATFGCKLCIPITLSLRGVSARTWLGVCQHTSSIHITVKKFSECGWRRYSHGGRECSPRIGGVSAPPVPAGENRACHQRNLHLPAQHLDLLRHTSRPIDRPRQRLSSPTRNTCRRWSRHSRSRTAQASWIRDSSGVSAELFRRPACPISLAPELSIPRR